MTGAMIVGDAETQEMLNALLALVCVIGFMTICTLLGLLYVTRIDRKRKAPLAEKEEL